MKNKRRRKCEDCGKPLGSTLVKCYECGGESPDNHSDSAESRKKWQQLLGVPKKFINNNND